MSSYDSRNMAQIKLDEMIWKYKQREREVEFMATRFKPDEELAKQMKLLLSDLTDLKDKLDKVSKVGGKIGNKN